MKTGSTPLEVRRCFLRRSRAPGAWLLLALAAVSDPVLALTCSANSTGNWSNPAIWSNCGGGTPGPADTVVISGSGAGMTITLNVNATVTALTLDAPNGNNRANTLAVGANTLTVTGDLTMSDNPNNRQATLSLSTGTVNVGGSIVVTASSGNANITFTGAGTLNVGGDFQSGVNLTPATGTVNYNGTGAQSIGVYTYNNLSVNKTAGTAALEGNVTVNGNLTVGTSGGTLDLGAFTANRASAGGTLSVVNGATLIIGGTNGFPANYATRTLGAASTVEYNGTNQPVANPVYGHLVLSGTGTKTPVSGTTTIAGNFTIDAGATWNGTANNPTVNLAGNFTNGGTFNSGTGTFTFNGTGGQALTGATTFTNMTLNDAAGLTLNNNATITGVLTFTNGKIATGGNRVVIGPSGSIANVSSARYVVGAVEKQFPASPSDPAAFNFPVGDPADYTPVQVDFTSLTNAGSLVVSTPPVPSDHPQIGTATLDQNLSVNRYWTITGEGGIAGTYDVTFNYVTGDKDPGSNPPDFIAQRFDGAAWFDTTRIGGVGNSIRLGGLTAFGDFAVAEPGGQQANHFVISHAGTGVNCAPVTVTITTHKPNHNVEDTISGPVTITARDPDGNPRGDWALVTGSGTFTPGAVNSGTATYSYVDADDGVVVLELLYTFPETVNIDVQAGTKTEHSGTANNGSEPVFTDPPLTMVDSGFILTSGATIGTQIAGKGSDVAPGAQALTVQAVRTDDETGACEAVFADGAELDIEMASECINPTSCSGPSKSADPRVRIITEASSNNVVDIDHYDAGSVPAPSPLQPLTPVTFRFGPNSAAPFVLNYPDAGMIRLHFRRNIPFGDGTGSGNFMLGTTNSFIVRPFAFSVEAPGNFTAADATGTAFAKAGETFNPSVEAVVWQAVDDMDNDGAPDAGADLTDNAVTPNFGNETAPPTVDITHQLVLPDPPGDAGTLSGGAGVGGFTGGVATPNLSFDEVGIIDLFVNHSDYLGDVDADITGGRRNVGRFYPDRFAVVDNAPSFADACTAGANPFTYQDQEFYYATAPALTVTALNAAGDVTENYGGGTAGAEGFWKLNTALDRDYTDQAGMSAGFGAVEDATVNLGADINDFDGTGTLSLSNAAGARDVFLYTRNDEEDPFTADVDLVFQPAALTDSDGACYDSDDDGACDSYTIAGISGATLRFGRLRIANASGSELLPLSLPMRAEYWNGGGFVVNSDDQCTSVAPTDLSLSSAVEAGQVDGDVDISNAGTCSGAGVTAAAIASQPFAAGDAGLSFSAPGPGCTGYADVTVDLSTATGIDLEWLRYDWDGNGSHDDDPAGRASFGIFRGDDDLIYIREPWD